MVPPPETPSVQELLAWAYSTFGSSFAITTSFQKEGMVLVNMAARISPEIRLITLDTGRLPEETSKIIETVRSRYGLAVETVVPEPRELEAMTHRFGPNLFYQDVSLRRLCCEVRKVRPLDRKLLELWAFATGLRREQSEPRADISSVEEADGRVKLNPLAAWTSQEVERYTVLHDVKSPELTSFAFACTLPRHRAHGFGTRRFESVTRSMSNIPAIQGMHREILCVHWPRELPLLYVNKNVPMSVH